MNNRLQVKAVSDFPYGQTGMCALGDGTWYFSEDGRAEDGWYTFVRLYRNASGSFERL